MFPLALGACYTNDIFREAGQRNIDVRAVAVEVQGDWGGDPVRAQNVTYTATVEAVAPEEVIRDLIEHTDRVAQIHNSLRTGADVTLTDMRAVSSEP